MNNLIQILKKLKPQNFAGTVLLALIILLAILFLNSVLFPAVNPTATTPIKNTEVKNINLNSVNTAEAAAIGAAGVNVITNPNSTTTPKILVIYVTNITSLSQLQINQLIKQAFATEGFAVGSVPYIFQEAPSSSVGSYTPEELLQLQNNNLSFDPTNPLTYPEYGNKLPNTPQIPEYKLYGTSFADYVRISAPVTDNFEIYLKSGTTYTVILKNGFTQQQFTNFLNQGFTDSSKYTFEYIDQDALRQP